MGGSTFEAWIWGYPNVNDAFNRKHDDEAHEYGHGGYTGTMAEKYDYIVIDAQPHPLVEAQRIAQRLIEEQDERIDDKWGPAGAIALMNSKDLPTRTVDVKFTVDGDLNFEGQRLHAEQQVKPRAGERVIDTKMTGQPQYVQKIEVTVPKEKAVTRYRVEGDYGYADRYRFATQAQARARAVQLAQDEISRPYGSQRTFTVQGVVERESGEALVSVAVRTIRTTYTAEVTLAKFSGAPKVTGWLFFGWASS